LTTKLSSSIELDDSAGGGPRTDPAWRQPEKAKRNIQAAFREGDMKKTLLAVAAIAALIGTPALAADMPVKAPPLAPAPVYSWAGFYLGANIGYGWRADPIGMSGDNLAGTFFLTAGFNPPPSVKTTGTVGGLQLGYNWQIDPKWLVGIETDFDASSVRGRASGFVIATNETDVSAKTPWFGTLRGRIGVLPTDRLLAYATGGMAYGQANANALVQVVPNIGFTSGGVLADGSSISCGVGAHAANITCIAGSGSRTQFGWTAGGGLEYAIWDRWTIKAEYLYVDLGSQTLHMTTVPFAGPPTTTGNASVAVNIKDAVNIVRFGVNHKF
jgi:outer membrane immunogenic protein